MPTGTASGPPGKEAVLVGAGGNIGSHLVRHLARMQEIRRLTVIDKDIYESKNLWGQDIDPADIDRPKALVQSERVRRINPGIEVVTFNVPVEVLPLGSLQSDLILACLDSRAARQYVNEAAWHLGVPWIDAGVSAGSLLARVNVYLPGQEQPCLECAWDRADYDTLEQEYPCGYTSHLPAPTNAPAHLGAFAASLQAVECAKILSGRLDLAAVGKQVLFELTHHRQYVTSFRRNPDCLLRDHEPWRIRRVAGPPDEITLDRLIGSDRRGADLTVQVAGRSFAKKLICPYCGESRSVVRLKNLAGQPEDPCQGCGKATTVSGVDSAAKLPVVEIPLSTRANPLSDLGIRVDDIVSIEDQTKTDHYRITGDPL